MRGVLPRIGSAVEAFQLSACLACEGASEEGSQAMRRACGCCCVIAILLAFGAGSAQSHGVSAMVAMVGADGPIADAGDDQTLEQASYEGAEATLDGSGSSGGGDGEAPATRVLDFEDLDPGHSGTGPIPSPYQELNWSGSSYWVTQDYNPTSGYGRTTEGRVAAYTAYIDPIAITGEVFDFLSAKVGSAWRASDMVVFEGYREGELVHSRTVEANNTGGAYFTFGFTEIDELRILPGASQAVFDNMTFGEPGAGSGRIVAWDWYEGETPLGSGETITAPLNLGEHRITLVVTDEAGNTAADECVVTVVDTTAPTLTVEGAPEYEQNMLDGAFVSHYDVEAAATDACDAAVAITFDPPEGATLPLGENVVTVTAEDASGNRTTAVFGVSVVDTTAPEISAPRKVKAEQESLAGTTVTLGWPDVTDLCDADVDVSNDAPDVFPLGKTTVTWTATDDSGNTASCTQLVIVVDTRRPRIESLSASPSVLRPANGRMVDVTVKVRAKDACDAAPVSRIVGVLSSEWPFGRGRRDWVVTGALSLQLRAECNGWAKERIYWIVVECVDASGNATWGITWASVPKNRGGGRGR